MLIEYLSSYFEKFALGDAKVIPAEQLEKLVEIDELQQHVKQLIENDDIMRNVEKLETDYPSGTQVEAQIVSVQDYGVFVEFGLNGSGLVHKSKFNGVLSDTSDTLEAGDWVTVEIIKYNAEHRKFDLKLVSIGGGTLPPDEPLLTVV
ncbi:hypothetical protein WJ16_04240 [Burkholderia metallica]|nr:hypothetical protein WJ16_04240 [Burkholderia metallica]